MITRKQSDEICKRLQEQFPDHRITSDLTYKAIRKGRPVPFDVAMAIADAVDEPYSVAPVSAMLVNLGALDAEFKKAREAIDAINRKQAPARLEFDYVTGQWMVQDLAAHVERLAALIGVSPRKAILDVEEARVWLVAHELDNKKTDFESFVRRWLRTNNKNDRHEPQRVPSKGDLDRARAELAGWL